MFREAIDRTRTLVAGRSQSVETRRKKLRTAIAEIEAELSRLTAALAAGGQLASVVAAIKEREGKRQALTGELKAPDGQQAVAGLDTRAIDRKIDAALRDWRQTIHTAARQRAHGTARERV